MAEKKGPKKFEEVQQQDKQKALEVALSQIEKQFGKGSVMKMGDDKTRMNVEVTPSGSLSIDIALGTGGIPKGRIIELYGPESSGKTTAALHMVAEVQKKGGIAGFIDAEHAMDPVYAKVLGVDIDNLYISQPDDGEQALEITETMVRSGAIDIVIVDSVAALVPRAEIEGEMGDSHMGLQARLMSQALRKLTGITSRSKCTVIFINQLREKIGSSYGNPETTTGGRALKFYASVRIDIRKTEFIKQGGEPIGNRTRVKIAKNKLAPPFKIAEFDIMYGHGISKEGDVLDLASDIDVVNKSGAWYSYKETRIGQGRENAKDYLKKNPQIMLEIENQVRIHYALPAIATVVSDKDDLIESAEDKPTGKAAGKGSSKKSEAGKGAEKPLTKEPVKEEPVKEGPVKEGPVKEGPVKEGPVKEEPVKEEPVKEEPLAEKPLTKELVTEEPLTKEPVAEEPLTEEPLPEEPLTEEPFTEESFEIDDTEFAFEDGDFDLD